MVFRSSSVGFKSISEKRVTMITDTKLYPTLSLSRTYLKNPSPTTCMVVVTKVYKVI